MFSGLSQWTRGPSMRHLRGCSSRTILLAHCETVSSRVDQVSSTFLCLTALWGQQRVWWEWMVSSGLSFCVNDLENRVLSLHWKQNQLSLVHEGPLSIAESPSFIKLWIQCSRYTAWVFTEDRRDGLQLMRGERHKGREGRAPYRYLRERPQHHLSYLMVWHQLH